MGTLNHATCIESRGKVSLDVGSYLGSRKKNGFCRLSFFCLSERAPLMYRVIHLLVFCVWLDSPDAQLCIGWWDTQIKINPGLREDGTPCSLVSRTWVVPSISVSLLAFLSVDILSKLACPAICTQRADALLIAAGVLGAWLGLLECHISSSFKFTTNYWLDIIFCLMLVMYL